MGQGSSCCNRPGHQRYMCISREAPFQNQCHRPFRFNSAMYSLPSIQKQDAGQNREQRVHVEYNEEGEVIQPFYSSSEEREEEENEWRTNDLKPFYGKSEEREEEEEGSRIQAFYSSSEEMEGEENEGDPKPFYSRQEEEEEEYDSRPPASHWDSALSATLSLGVKEDFADWLDSDNKLYDDIKREEEMHGSSCFNYYQHMHTQPFTSFLNTTQLICAAGTEQDGQCNKCCKAGAYVGKHYLKPEECPYLQCRKLFLYFYQRHKRCINNPRVCGHFFVECCQRQQHAETMD